MLRDRFWLKYYPEEAKLPAESLMVTCIYSGFIPFGRTRNGLFETEKFLLFTYKVYSKGGVPQSVFTVIELLSFEKTMFFISGTGFTTIANGMVDHFRVFCWSNTLTEIR